MNRSEKRNELDDLNYHHLRYFWAVARAGSIAKACQELRVSASSVSTQIKILETCLGVDLFDRIGKRMVLTDAGRHVHAYAEQIFSLGREMTASVRHFPADKPLRLRVGLADVIPKLFAQRLLQPALAIGRDVHLICREDRVERLEAELAAYRLDVIIADRRLSQPKIKAYSHLIGECEVALFGTPELADRYRRRFPYSLENAPLLVPTDNNDLRRQLDRWLAETAVVPRIVGEFDDTALMKEFGARGLGIFPAFLPCDKEVRRRYGTRRVGIADSVRARIYAITLERKLKHPAVMALYDTAREDVFA